MICYNLYLITTTTYMIFTPVLFIPINIERSHWYLAVVNAQKHEIQVLDSLGSRINRSDLTVTATTILFWYS